MKEEAKHRLAWRNELLAISLIVMEELNSGESPYIRIFTVSQEVTNGLTLWSGRRTMDTFPIKRGARIGYSIWKLL